MLHGDLGQEEARERPAAQVEPVAADADVVGARDATAGREDADLDAEVANLLGRDGVEPVVARGGRRGHLLDRAPERLARGEVADASAELAVPAERDKGRAGVLDLQGDRGGRGGFAAHGRGRDGFAGDGDQGASGVGVEHGPIIPRVGPPGVPEIESPRAEAGAFTLPVREE